MHILPLALSSLPILVLALPSAAQQPRWKSPSPAPRQELPARVRHAVSSTGAELARGTTYKASFDSRGATYAPFLGSKAPRSFPLLFRLESLSIGAREIAFAADAAPVRADDVVTFDRGSVVERYELSLDSIEQILVFENGVFEDLGGSGDLLVRYAVEGDLPIVDSEAGIAFGNELGGVRYGAATAFDARGRGVACDTTAADGGIEIRVPAGFLATAALPLTIDPIVTTFAVDSGTEDAFLPDVAYDFNNQNYMLVYEQTFSATDHDVLCEMRSSAGAYIDDAYIDLSLDEYWANPKVACNRHYLNYLVVAEVGLPSGGTRSIRGRFVFSDLGFPGVIVVGSGITITENAESGEKINPDVGSDPRDDADSHYLIVWERIFSASDRDIHARSIRGDFGAFTGVFYIDDSGSTFDRNPSISESCGFDGRHHVAWERKIDTTNSDLYAAELAWNGFVTIPSTPVITGIAETEHPAVASILDLGGNWLLAYEHSVAASTDHDIRTSLMNGVTVLETVNLSALEGAFGSGTEDEEQITPEADSDGVSFAVVYSESYQGSATDYDIYAATLTPVAGRLKLSEGHQNLAFNLSQEDHPRLACIRSSGAGAARALVVWDDLVTAGNHNLVAALYDCEDFTSFCFPGDDAIACPCGNPPAGPNRGCQNSSGTGGATLYQTGTASLAADTVVFSTAAERPTATSVLIQGSTTANNVFGQAVRCVGGQLKRLYTKNAVGGSIVAPTGSELPVSARSAALGAPLSAGQLRTYLVYYRDPVVLGGCPVTSTFNATQSGAITWRP